MSTTRGRPDIAAPYDRTVLAVDIGGTKVAAAIVDGHGCIHAEDRASTPDTDDPETVFAVVAEVVGRVRDASDLEPSVCGVGCGGPMDTHGERVSPLNIRAWRGFPVRGRLAELVGLPVAIDNDAKALALGEGWLGAARGVRDYLAIVVSTGVGGGIVLDGRLLDGREGNAGHIGHVVVVPEGRSCSCGGTGCLEAEASGIAIEAVTGRPPSDAPHDVRRRSGMLVGRAIASVANLLDLELAVVAGSVALGYGAAFFDAAQEEIELRCRLAFSRSTRVEPAGLGANGPIIGAAAVGLRSMHTAPGNRGST